MKNELKFSENRTIILSNNLGTFENKKALKNLKSKIHLSNNTLFRFEESDIIYLGEFNITGKSIYLFFEERIFLTANDSRGVNYVIVLEKDTLTYYATNQIEQIKYNTNQKNLVIKENGITEEFEIKILNSNDLVFTQVKP